MLDYKKSNNSFIVRTYLISLFVLFLFNLFEFKNFSIFFSEFKNYLFPLLGTLVIFLLCKIFKHRNNSYVLYFLIFFVMFFDLTGPMSGNFRNNSNPVFWGLAFYSVSFAYLFYKNSEVKYIELFQISNPLLLFTGPFSIFFKNISAQSSHSQKSKQKTLASLLQFSHFILLLCAVLIFMSIKMN
jgi:hypothetical protein